MKTNRCFLLIAPLLLISELYAQDKPGELGDEKQVRVAIKKALTLLERASAGSAENRTCFTCHGQALPVMAITEAKLRGFEIAEENLQRQLKHTASHLKRGQKNYLQGKGQGGRVDTAGYALWALEAGQREPDEITAAVTEYLLKSQNNVGYFETGFPHGKDQFISTSATAWSAIALLLSLPEIEAVDKTTENAQQE